MILSLLLLWNLQFWLQKHQRCVGGRGLYVCVFIWTTMPCRFFPRFITVEDVNVFAPSVFVPYRHTGDLSMKPFYLHNFTEHFPCWDVPLWISQCCSFIRRSYLNCMCHVTHVTLLFLLPPHSKWLWKGKAVLLYRYSSEEICMHSPSEWQWAGEECGGAFYCTSSPSARYEGLQALLLSSSHLCSWVLIFFPLELKHFQPLL